MMKSIDRERVLRLNCPGFGDESHLNLGRAKSLDNYQVIIANPVSLLHLFDKGPEPTRRINQLLSEGVNQLNVPDDALIQELINESDSRLEELIPFLSQGGLLVYFLCRPFVLAGPTISVDNYDWLSVYAPAVKSPPDNGSRQMSALSHGRVVETTEEGRTSEMAEYLDQSSIEWNTIIRTDFLSSNYSVLATAAQKKCIAAQFWAGDNGGKVIFLPAPYSPDFDRVLMNCVNKWYQDAIIKGFIKDDSVPFVPAVEPESQSDSPPLADKVPTQTMDEARLEEIMASLASHHASSTAAAEAKAKAPAENSEEAQSVPMPPKQPPKGALKGLFSSDALDPFDDDDEFIPAPVPAPVSVAAPASSESPTRVTAEEILSSVSAEANKNPDAFQEMEPIPLYDPSGESQPQSAPEVALVNNFELKKATAAMDLSQFAETARQLVQQANEIETATRDPNVVTTSNPKPKIADILKGLEFGGDKDDELEPTAPEVTDVVSTPVQAEAPPPVPEYRSEPSPFASEAARLMESLHSGSGLNEGLNIAGSAPSAPAAAPHHQPTMAEIERAEIEAASKNLESVLRPEMDAPRNFLETGRYQLTDEPVTSISKEEVSVSSEPVSAPAEPEMPSISEKELIRLTAEREAREIEEFRKSFEFLKEEDEAAGSYQPETLQPSDNPIFAGSENSVLEPAAAPQQAFANTSSSELPAANSNQDQPPPPPALPEPEIYQGKAPLPPPVEETQERSSLRSLLHTLGASRLEPQASAKKEEPALETHDSLSAVPSAASHQTESLAGNSAAPSSEQPIEQVAEKSDLSLDQPVDRSLDKPLDKIADKQIETIAEEQVVNSSFTPVTEEPENRTSERTETPTYAAAEQPAQTSAHTAASAAEIFPGLPPEQKMPAMPMPVQTAPDLSTAVPPQPVPATPLAAPAAEMQQYQQFQNPNQPPASQPPAVAPPAAPSFMSMPETPQPRMEQPQAPQPDLIKQPIQQPIQQPMQEFAQHSMPEPVQQQMSQPVHAHGTNGDGNARGMDLSTLQSNDQSAPQPKELIKKMEEMTKTAPSTWCDEFSFPFIDLLKNEHQQMAEQIRQMQTRLNSVEARIQAVDTLKVILLTGEGDALLGGTQEVLTRLGWQVQQSKSNANELWLSRGDQVEAIARIVHSSLAANRTEVAQLAESVIAFWDEHEIEPKGILIAQTWSSKHPSERSEPDFSPALQEFAGKKHLSLMSTMQLLSMYKDIELNTMPVDEMRKRMIDTSGRLLGFPLDSNVAQAATGAR